MRGRWEYGRREPHATARGGHGVHPEGNAAYQFGTGVKVGIRFHGNYLAGGGFLLNGGVGAGGDAEFRYNVFGPSRFGAHRFVGGNIVFDRTNVRATTRTPIDG